MREIKFRAWDKRFKTMDFGSGDLLLRINSDDFSEPQQFVGIKDKNGVDIYEGDIVQYRSMNNTPYRKAQIRILGGGTTATALETKIYTTDGYVYPLSNELEFPITKSEIIGNISKNPNLIK